MCVSKPRRCRRPGHQNAPGDADAVNQLGRCGLENGRFFTAPWAAGVEPVQFAVAKIGRAANDIARGGKLRSAAGLSAPPHWKLAT
jgi:hypothetical protein